MEVLSLNTMMMSRTFYNFTKNWECSRSFILQSNRIKKKHPCKIKGIIYKKKCPSCMIKKTLEISILYKGAHATIISLLPAKNHQIPLIHIVHEDDVVLLNTQDAEWFKILYHFPWKLEQFDQIMRESG